ncbi:YegP family protein [Anaeromassilibacillus senegalensis]|uniref:YegP family protein n=1 Tax=Anaeromassilibacillus senegalensis TaxID=1673717 RepID=A0ABS9CLJ3_9FIRM|nr:YegP family protein [Anaeromassilibacillus senegalensis]MCF2652010.1 YegP family protein [Anaeromassilibacillus senegalensis]
MGKFVIRKTETGLVFHLKARNGQTVAVSQIYASMEACRKGIESVIRHAAQAAVEDQTVRRFEPEKHPKFEIYKDRAGQFRFRLVASNGQNIVAGAGYSTKENCRKGIESLRRQCAQNPKIILE